MSKPLNQGAATERRIADLQVAMDAALAAGDRPAFKALFDQWNAARADRSPEQLHQLGAQHSARVEYSVAMADRGFYPVPGRWLATGKRAGPVVHARTRDWDDSLAGGETDDLKGVA